VEARGVIRGLTCPGRGEKPELSMVGVAGLTPGNRARVTVVLLPGSRGELIRGLGVTGELPPGIRAPADEALGCLVAGE